MAANLTRQFGLNRYSCSNWGLSENLEKSVSHAEESASRTILRGHIPGCPSEKRNLTIFSQTKFAIPLLQVFSFFGVPTQVRTPYLIVHLQNISHLNLKLCCISSRNKKKVLSTFKFLSRSSSVSSLSSVESRYCQETHPI